MRILPLPTPVLLSVLMLPGLAGCPNSTEKSLLRAQEALEACDLRDAHGHFDDAYALSEDDARAALGFALTDVIFLAEDPNVTRILVALGAEGPIDPEAFLFGKNALLDRLAEHQDCDTIDAFVEDALPYAPLRDDDIDPLSLIDADLTIDDLLDDAKKLDGRLARASRAFSFAAAHLEEPYTVTLDGSCGGGIGEIVIHPPELFGAAAALELVRAIVQLGDGYDWDLRISDLASEDDARIVDTCNAHVGRLTDPDAVAEGGATFLRALDLADRGLAAAIALEEPAGNSAFAWDLLDEQMVAEMRELGDAARRSLDAGGVEPIPFWTPELGADLGALVSDPPDAGALDGPLFEVDPSHGGVLVKERRFEALFEGYFDREVFQSDQDEYLDVDWDQDLEEVLNPGGRYDRYSCE